MQDFRNQVAFVMVTLCDIFGSQLSRPEARYLAPEASYLAPEASYLAPEASYLAPEASYIAQVLIGSRYVPNMVP